MKDGTSNKPEPVQDLADLDQSELASQQAATPVPYCAGERKIAVQWISPVFNLYSKSAGSVTKK
jgi:hypothetical protein